MGKAATTNRNVPATQAAASSENLPATASDHSLFDGVGTGFENVKAADLLIPRLTILQGLSPQVTQGEPQFMPDARVGQILDTALSELFNEVVFLPIYFQEQFLEWEPREKGGGLRGIHEGASILNETEKDDMGHNVLKNGNYVQETYQLYGYNISAGFRKCFIPFVSTQRKKCKQILTLGTSEKLKRQDGSEFQPPMFYRAYHLSTTPESNKKGKWMGWKIARDKALPELRPDFAAFMADDIKPFRASLAEGTVKGDIESMAREAGRPEDNDGTM